MKGKWEMNAKWPGNGKCYIFFIGVDLWLIFIFQGCSNSGVSYILTDGHWRQQRPRLRKASRGKKKYAAAFHLVWLMLRSGSTNFTTKIYYFCVVAQNYN